MSKYQKHHKDNIMKKTKTYMDKLMQDKDFREKFDIEYQKLCAEEKKAKVKSDKYNKTIYVMENK
jgi:hypothetical protein